MQSEQINELVLALSVAQNEFEPVVKNCKNPFFKSDYADLASCIDGTKKALSKNGLAVIQTTDIGDEKALLYTTLAHKSGQWIAGLYPVNPVKADPQGYGAALTYARRYAYCAIVGIAAEDDDGNVASGLADKKEPPKTLAIPPKVEPIKPVKPKDEIDDEIQKKLGFISKAQINILVAEIKAKKIDPKIFGNWLLMWSNAHVQSGMLLAPIYKLANVPEKLYSDVLTAVGLPENWK
jgi:hypothetical protein